ncbi:hypothetical protein [Cellulomonas endophytica]|uniref:hypothetical protein n=1 Tax=Cellulomonas endophytica TaxID=2494735 RepID=UPI001012CC4C|nr:hypothetical protein [Cellulomonas endophytica]
MDIEVRGREQVADWVETALLVRGTRPLAYDELERLAQDEIGTGSAQVALATRALRRRADVLGAAYPFVVNDFALRARPDARRSVYASLVLMSAGSVARATMSTTAAREMEVLFEQLAEQALARVWGDVGRAVRFGWPSEVGRPQSFPAAIKWLADLLGVPAGTGYRPPIRKDGGVDVVAWRPFADGRSGFPVVLAQCTLQAELISKASDVEPRVWASWLTMDVDPVTALVVPQTIADDRLWEQLALRGMVVERLRLAELCGQQEVVGAPAWNNEVLSRLEEHMSMVVQ